MSKNIDKNMDKIMSSITSLDSEEIRPRTKEDMKCAPGRKFESGSCFTTGELVEMADAYNKEHNNKEKIPINEVLDRLKISKVEILSDKNNNNKNNNKYREKYDKYEKKIKKFLVKEFNKKLGDKCKTQKCWTEQKFMNNIKEERRNYIKTHTMRPSGPSTGREWLNTINIDQVLEQYENVYTDFEYLGTMPRDFQNHNFLRQDENFYKELFKSGKTKVAMVYNTDKLGGSGEHWNAMFADFTKGRVLFFDSYGVEPGKETKEHMELIKKVMRETCAELSKIKSDYNHNDLMKQLNDNSGGELKCNLVKLMRNDKRAQFKGSECGVYSINFILRMLRGDKFEDICQDKIPDDKINKCRKVYFRKE
jgi:hypothetical protein